MIILHIVFQIYDPLHYKLAGWMCAVFLDLEAKISLHWTSCLYEYLRVIGACVFAKLILLTHSETTRIIYRFTAKFLGPSLT